jgi:predicted RNA-binding Zn-ribbon protein involved in translation (DUF1610 family)
MSESRMTWMHKIRLRVLGLLVGLALAVIATISLTTVPAWPVIGVAFATLAIAVNKMTNRLSQPTCWGCGEDLAAADEGVYGAECPSCGYLTPRGSDMAWAQREGAAGEDDELA